jgi:hypothetical protein
MSRTLIAAALALLVPVSAGAATRCDQVLKSLSETSSRMRLATKKSDLTTNGDSETHPTTPKDNEWVPGTVRCLCRCSPSPREPTARS